MCNIWLPGVCCLTACDEVGSWNLSYLSGPGPPFTMLGSALDCPVSHRACTPSTQCLPLPIPSSPCSGSPDPQREFRKRHKQRKAVLSPAGSAVGTPGHSEETKTLLELAPPWHFTCPYVAEVSFPRHVLPSLGRSLFYAQEDP